MLENQAFELLMMEIKRLRSDIESLKKFRWIHVGFVMGISTVVSFAISVLYK